MDARGTAWLVVLIVACVLYFGVALFVIVRGGQDLKELFAGGTKDQPEGLPDGESAEPDEA